jgi:hypothetical protein
MLGSPCRSSVWPNNILASHCLEVWRRLWCFGQRRKELIALVHEYGEYSLHFTCMFAWFHLPSPPAMYRKKKFIVRSWMKCCFKLFMHVKHSHIVWMCLTLQDLLAGLYQELNRHHEFTIQYCWRIDYHIEFRASATWYSSVTDIFVLKSVVCTMLVLLWLSQFLSVIVSSSKHVRSFHS